MNLHGVKSIYVFEMTRAWRTIFQSVVSPVIATAPRSMTRRAGSMVMTVVSVIRMSTMESTDTLEFKRCL